MHGDGSILIGICQSDLQQKAAQRIEQKLRPKRAMEESEEKKVLKTMIAGGRLGAMGIVRH